MDLANEIIERARQFGSGNEQQRTYLLGIVRKQPPQVAIAALLSIFSRSNRPPEAFEEQELAGYLLWHCSHACPISAKDVILAVADGWNFSVEEVPWYLCREFGAIVVRDCITTLLLDSQHDQHRRALETLAYWTRAYDPPQDKR